MSQNQPEVRRCTSREDGPKTHRAVGVEFVHVIDHHGPVPVPHRGLGLPWAWKHGGPPFGRCPSDGERTQFRDLLSQLPQAALVVADAGFVGYLLWKTIMDSGRHFLIRVGANVELLQERFPDCKIEQEGEIVWLWPDGKRKNDDPPPKAPRINTASDEQRESAKAHKQPQTQAV